MDEVCLRFPHICVMIFDTLDDQTLVKCRLVSKHWKSCIDAEKFLWSRIIQKYIGRPNLKRSLYVNNPNSKRSRTEPRNIVQRLRDLSPEGNFWRICRFRIQNWWLTCDEPVIKSSQKNQWQFDKIFLKLLREVWL